MKNLLKIAVLMMIGLLLFSCATAQAQMKFGVRQHNFHNSFLPSEQTLGAYFGFGIGEQMDLIFGADYYSFKLSTDVDLGGSGATSEASLTASSIWLHAGVKFFLADRDKGEVAPYILGELFKGFGSLSVDPETDADYSAAEDLLSPYGFIAGFGAEFFAADNFSVGGETGIRYVITKSEGIGGLIDMIDLGGLDFSKPVATLQDEEAKLTTVTIYTGITVNFAL